jgi:hypothetical protein
MITIQMKHLEFGDVTTLGYHVFKECQQVLETTIIPFVARLQLEKFYHRKQSRVLNHTTIIEWLPGVFDHLVLCKFSITVLIIVTVSLDIAYHLIYVMLLKLDFVIGQP